MTVTPSREELDQERDNAAFALAAGERYERALEQLFDEMPNIPKAAPAAEAAAEPEPATEHTSSRSRWKRRLRMTPALRRWRR